MKPCGRIVGFFGCLAAASVLASGAAADEGTVPAEVGGRVFVVEREDGRLAVYDYLHRRLLDRRIEGLGNLRHATMTFSPGLRFGYVAARDGLLSRIDLESLRVVGQARVSSNSIDIAISQDGRFIATAEYQPGGLTILDAKSLKIVRRIPAQVQRDGKTLRSRVTGVVDAAGNRFVCSLMEGAEVWIVDAGREDFPLLHRLPTRRDMPYDAMITPDGRYYLVGHLGSDVVSLVDVRHPERGVREISLRDPTRHYERGVPVKLPHMAAWAVAGQRVFVPLVGEKRLAVLRLGTWEFEGSVPLRGHPVYAVARPSGEEVWVTFSGVEDDRYVQVVDTERLEVRRTIDVGPRLYHLDFAGRGAWVLASANGADQIVLIDANRYEIVDRQSVHSPSGIFGLWRAFRIGL